MASPEVGGYLLAGGKSSRMGRDKALLELGGESLVERAIRKLGEVCVEVAIAGGTEDLARFGRVILDKSTGCGPLGGIVSALGESSFQWNLFLPVDAPFVPVSALEELISQTRGFDGMCVMARTGGQIQPLCAVYSKKSLGVLQRELAAGRWKVMRAIEAAGGIRFVDFEDAGWFANLNTPEEFAEAEKRPGALDT
jgi:molybdenum cofactor guanylyltransferase